MPSSFLGSTQQIETGLGQTILLQAEFSPLLYKDAIFPAHGIDLPVLLSTAVDKRKSEFLAGRTLVAQAFKHLNIPSQNVPRGPKREPVWPLNVQGSITHSRDHCACILTTKPNLFVGIDLEAPLSENALRSVRRVAMIANDGLVYTSQSTFSEQHFATLLFSAKETLYKALFPIVQSFFGFDAATIHNAPSDNQIELRLTRNLHSSLLKDQIFTLNHQELDGKILTWLAYQHSNPSGV